MNCVLLEEIVFETCREGVVQVIMDHQAVLGFNEIFQLQDFVFFVDRVPGRSKRFEVDDA